MTTNPLFPLATPTQAKRQTEALARARAWLGTRAATHPASVFVPRPDTVLDRHRKEAQCP